MDVFFLQEKSFRILLRPFPRSTRHPPTHERLHMQVNGVASNTKNTTTQIHKYSLGQNYLKSVNLRTIWSKSPPRWRRSQHFNEAMEQVRVIQVRNVIEEYLRMFLML